MIVGGGEQLRRALEAARRNIESGQWPERDPNKLFPWDEPEDQPEEPEAE